MLSRRRDVYSEWQNKTTKYSIRMVITSSGRLLLAWPTPVSVWRLGNNKRCKYSAEDKKLNMPKHSRMLLRKYRRLWRWIMIRLYKYKEMKLRRHAIPVRAQNRSKIQDLRLGSCRNTAANTSQILSSCGFKREHITFLDTCSHPELSHGTVYGVRFSDALAS